MSSTRPLAKTGSDLERLLLSAGTDERPDDESVRRAAVVLGIAPRAALVAVVTGTVAVALRANRSATAAAWVSVGAIGLAGLAFVAHVARPAPRTPMVAAGVAAGAAAAGATHAANVEVAPGTPAPAIASQAPVAGAAPAEARASTHHGAPEGSSRLREQAVLLDGARGLLATDDARSALLRLNEFDRRFAGGPLHEEALVLRIEALGKLGDKAAAATLARRFLEAYPGSVQGGRVTAIARQMQEDPGP
ncbi:MAG TPA: hypothetical protein VH044_16015 [Polyangiaceae bacterium]|jgi:hypothetical protein|nr:hypothetical protein [Polyangiaceae bacterium]